VHVGPSGAIQAIYRKIHMFDVEIEGRLYRESELEQPGEEIVTSAGGSGLPIGLAICYDLRFPELFRILALRGALLVALPSAFTLPTTRDHWEILLRARAIENQCFMVAANQVGEHPDGCESGGRSMIVDPWGRVLGSLGEQGEGHVVAEIDLGAQAQIRHKLPSLENRQAQAYRWPAGTTAPEAPARG
jgi:deaminated glutathione amidase